MRQLLLLSLCVLSALGGACAPAKLATVSFVPKYQFMEEIVNVPLARDCAAVSSLTVEDGRDDKSSVGHRFLQENRSEDRLIEMTGGPVGWIRSGIEENFRLTSLEHDRAGKPGLRVIIKRVLLEESVYRNAEFDGKVILDFELRRPGSSEVCWSGRKEGFAENYGSPGNPQNYEETLNHALDRALLDLAGDSGFADALCGGCGG